QPPNQPKGGGFNSTLSVDLSGLPGGKLSAANQSVEVQFQFGVVQKGSYNICLITEALPGGGSQVYCLSGNTDIAPPTITKAFNPTSIQSGGTSTVTLTLTNSNASALTNAAFSDMLTNMSAAGG